MEARRRLPMQMIIAIDGPAAAGKSTLARALAKRLGLAFLDTGAMYRAVTLEVLERGIDPDDAEGCEGVAREIRLELDGTGGILVDGRDPGRDLRSDRVNRAVSPVSAHPGVRRQIVPMQRRVAASAPRGVVAEGRDTTTVVFPDAGHKFFLNASSRVRAQRRADETGQPERVDEIRAEIDARDAYDRERADSPLRQAPDAQVIDTDHLDPEGVLRLFLESLPPDTVEGHLG